MVGTVVAGLGLADFLRQCADSLDGPAEGGFAEVRDAFVAGGLTSVRVRSQWIQLGVAPAPGAYPEVCRRLAEHVRPRLADGTVGALFHLNKPPGLRIRLRTGDRALAAEVERWRSDGLVTGVVPGVYEPEQALFGGAASMPYVHDLFTADSLAWLDVHADGGAGAPAWLMSLAMLRALHAALGIEGWEALDVWDRVRRQTGRRLPDRVLASEEFAATAADLRALWVSPDLLADRLGSRARAVADRFAAAAEPVGAAWHEGYFGTAAARIGPREAAAFVTIFHWNRALLPMTVQGLLTEGLAGRP